MTAVNLGTLPNNLLPAVTRVSDNGLFIIRVPRNADSSWYDSLTLISILGDPHLQHLAPPSSNNFTPTPNPPILASEPSTSSSASIKNDPVLTIPHRRTLGFSPGARYIGAFDGLGAFTWSTGEAASIHHCEAHAGYNLDESWIKCPFYVLLQKEDEWGSGRGCGRSLKSIRPLPEEPRCSELMEDTRSYQCSSTANWNSLFPRNIDQLFLLVLKV
ncbi:uncharacterized protein EI90DRAFT_747226 [Cantharellus anzutake]|uniref:uncharacterized protein n=1 Tax=Cantharellus anzutake TaxID=1750568 RepID=UPI001906B53B|nr:uncharacterized protein EI90DRAFT_747226 [Cantharellus anzutake]KAF8312162.1 hypothetical protein EI90DRAFT_747226 [Cantharellus anzutake]